MLKPVALVFAATVSLLAFSATAWASPQGEARQGAQIVGEVQAGKLKGASLSAEQYTHVGQYLMSRAFNSAATYEAMDNLMDRMMGSSAADQMYRYLGERYYGKGVQPEGRYGPMYGWMGSMMRAYGAMPYAGMMGGYLSGQGTGTSTTPGGGYPMGGMMGYGFSGGASGSSGWPTAAIVAVAVLGALLIGALAAVALPRLRGGGSSGRPASPAAH